MGEMGTVKWGQTTILAITRKTRSVPFFFYGLSSFSFSLLSNGG
jgi:hypothetical protein